MSHSLFNGSHFDTAGTNAPRSERPGANPDTSESASGLAAPCAGNFPIPLTSDERRTMTLLSVIVQPRQVLGVAA